MKFIHVIVVGSWKKNTYEKLLLDGLEPEKLDKDAVRDWEGEKHNVILIMKISPEVPNDVGYIC